MSNLALNKKNSAAGDFYSLTESGKGANLAGTTNLKGSLQENSIGRIKAFILSFFGFGHVMYFNVQDANGKDKQECLWVTKDVYTTCLGNLRQHPSTIEIADKCFYAIISKKQ